MLDLTVISDGQGGRDKLVAGIRDGYCPGKKA
jgi:hypothetical protein